MIPNFTSLGSGPTVLMLHGVGGGHLAFAPQVETLASSGYRAVAWDMPGYGHSAPIEPYNFKGLAQSCIALIEALIGSEDPLGGQRSTRSDKRGGDIEPRRAVPSGEGPLGGQRSTRSDKRGGHVILVGHSMGGMVAQEVVARRPELVSKLVLCGTSPSFGHKPDGRPAEVWQRDFITQRTAPLDAGQSMAELAATLVPRMVGPGSLPEGVKLAVHTMGLISPATYRRALQALVTFDRRDSLAQIHVPTLVLAGEFDKVAAPSVMKKMAAAIAGSTYLELRGVGHLQNLEAPDEFDSALLNFLELPRALH